jgi:hypothetical protein
MTRLRAEKWRIVINVVYPVRPGASSLAKGIGLYDATWKRSSSVPLNYESDMPFPFWSGELTERQLDHYPFI